MAGPGGVPSGHAVAVEVAVVFLQLLQAVKPHKAVLAQFFLAQEVLAPTLHSKWVSPYSGRKTFACLANACISMHNMNVSVCSNTYQYILYAKKSFHASTCNTQRSCSSVDHDCTVGNIAAKQKRLFAAAPSEQIGPDDQHSMSSVSMPW